MIFTQERYNNFLYESDYLDINVDVLFIDEAHKLADKSSKRSLTLYKVISASLEKYSGLKLIFQVQSSLTLIYFSNILMLMVKA
jgi:DNA replication protein DnaC